jgi:rhomboid protease GluP
MTETYPITFALDSDQTSRTHWRWKGTGTLCQDAVDVHLEGRRWRPLLPGRKQSVSFPISHIRDVEQSGKRLDCRVQLENGREEPLALQFEGEPQARAIAASWPKTKSTTFHEIQAFQAGLTALGGRVLVTYAVIGICVLVFVAMAIAGVSLTSPTSEQLIAWGSNFGPLTLEGQSWRLWTSMFLHIGIVHLLFNMAALASIGPLTEKLLGNVRFAIVYVCAGLTGSMTSVLLHPMTNSAGASGAIFGVMGALLAIMVRPASRVPAGIAKTHRNTALIFIAYNVFYGLSHVGIDNAAHVGGLFSGAVLGWLLARPVVHEERDRDHHAHTSIIPGVAAAALLLWSFVQLISYPLPDHVVKRVQPLTAFYDAESAAAARESELQTKRDWHRISELEWANRTLKETVPLWRTAEDVAFDVPAQDSRVLAARKELVQYADLRALQAELHAEYVISRDPAKFEWANSTKWKAGFRAVAARTAAKKALE